MLPPNTLARIAGPLYLLLIVAAAFALSVRSAILEPDAATATADNIRASATLFRVSFVVDLVANLVYLLTAMALYLLFRHVHELVAAAMVTFVAVSVAVGSLNLLNHYTALTIATSDAYARSFGEAGADMLAQMFAGMSATGTPSTRSGTARGWCRWGTWSSSRGTSPRRWVSCRSSAASATSGWLLTTFLAPDAPAAIGSALLAVAAIGEGAFVVWLVIRGVRLPAAAPARSLPSHDPE